MHTTIDCCNFLKMNNLGKKIAEARIAKGLNQSELSRILGVTPQAVQKWEAGTSQPKGSRLKNVADALGLSVSLLLDEERTAPTLIPSGEYKIAGPSSIEPSRNESPNIYAGPDLRGKVPVISWVQAGAFCEAIDNLHTGDAYDWIETSVHVRSHTFALRVHGDSMEPTFPEGVIIVIEPELDPLPGDYVIAKNGDEEATFKQLVKDGADWYLKPLNPRYPIKPLAESRIVGVVRSAEQRFR